MIRTAGVKFLSDSRLQTGGRLTLSETSPIYITTFVALIS
jgi:hypothetical protein